MVIGKDITLEQVERLFHCVHACYSKEDLIMLSQEELNSFAKAAEKEWK